MSMVVPIIYLYLSKQTLNKVKDMVPQNIRIISLKTCRSGCWHQEVTGTECVCVHAHTHTPSFWKIYIYKNDASLFNMGKQKKTKQNLLSSTYLLLAENK